MRRCFQRLLMLQGIFACTLLVHTAAVGFVPAPQLIQVPFSGFGDVANAYPLSLGPARYQQIYSASAFPYGGTIDKIMFRNEEDPSWDLPFTNMPFFASLPTPTITAVGVANPIAQGQDMTRTAIAFSMANCGAIWKKKIEKMKVKTLIAKTTGTKIPLIRSANR